MRVDLGLGVGERLLRRLRSGQCGGQRIVQHLSRARVLMRRPFRHRHRDLVAGDQDVGDLGGMSLQGRGVPGTITGGDIAGVDAPVGEDLVRGQELDELERGLLFGGWAPS